MLGKVIGLLGILLVFSINFIPAFALTDMQRATINDPRLETALGGLIGNDITVNQQVQISADITNHQDRTQNFVYFIQVKNEMGFVVSLDWITGQLIPAQKFNAARSWTPNLPGEFTVEIFVWGGIANHNALSDYVTLQINVS